MTLSISRRQALRAGLALPSALLFTGCRADAPAPESPRLRTREVQRVVDSMATMEGAGVKLHRALGTRALPMLDPFLLLDEIHSNRAEDYLPGFPTHPHRGFETVTYMLNGVMEHGDSLGNSGRLGPGSAQWMTAGHGIVHSEMPKQESGAFWGFQLWVNLPKARKLIAPRYQNIDPERIAEAAIEEARVRVVAGEVAGKRGPVEGIVTEPQLLDVTLGARGRFTQPIPSGHNAFAYVIEGAAMFGDSRALVQRGQIALLGSGDTLSASSDAGARFLLASAQPIGEPVARSGPFVMNTDDELQRAWDDYRAGTLTRL